MEEGMPARRRLDFKDNSSYRRLSGLADLSHCGNGIVDIIYPY